jgi:hypothetical protein
MQKFTNTNGIPGTYSERTKGNKILDFFAHIVIRLSITLIRIGNWLTAIAWRLYGNG